MFIEHPLLGTKGKPRSLVHGVGINDASYMVGYKNIFGNAESCPYYDKWRAMLSRCYSAKFHERHPSYQNCTVADTWKTFSVFRTWMETQDWQGKALDKDLLNWGNKHYSPDTCLFISQAQNSLLALRGNARGLQPLGVVRTVVHGKYVYYEAKCSFYGKQVRLGSFKTPEEAAAKYQEAKLAYIAELAAAEPNQRIKQALLALH